MTQRKIEYWVIPPQADAEFVANMEQVLDLYQAAGRWRATWDARACRWGAIGCAG